MLRYTCRNADRPGFECPEGMPPALHRLLAGRGITSAEEAEAFLNPGLHSLRDPMLLSDMDRATARLRRAMEAGEAICVYGDYDVDGVCATAILAGWLISRGANARWYLPSRHNEGYGLNEAAVREIAGWANLMVTVDCGVTATALVTLAKELGLDVIVTDHHRPPEGPLPDCPVVDPLLGGYPFAYLCGAGLAWKLVWAMEGEQAALPWVDLAALATVADVVSLTDENRAIVRLGLDAIARSPRPGVAALIEAAGVADKPVTSTTIAFTLAPRLNAGGRMGSAERSLELLLETDRQKARLKAAELEQENARRREVETEILQQAQAQLEGFDFAAHRALILWGENWNPGVIGLAASRLVEMYHYPVVLLAGEQEKLTGSCRSIEGVDIHAALKNCAGMLVRFGGHKQAAGLTILKGDLPRFRRAMDEWLWANVEPSVYVPVYSYDAELSLEEATPSLIAALEALQPTGFGNPAPLFRCRAHLVEARGVGADGAHLKLTLAQGGHRLGGIAFREGHRARELSGEIDALFTLQLNTWMGRTEPQLGVKALAQADPTERLEAQFSGESALQCRFLTGMLYNREIPAEHPPVSRVGEETLISWLRQRPQGMLVIASDAAVAARLLRLASALPPDLAIEALPTDPRAFNALCLCPPPGAIPRGYDRVVLAGVPEAWLPPECAGQVFRLEEMPCWAQKLADIEDMRRTYRALMDAMRRPMWLSSFEQLCRMAAQRAEQEDVTATAAILAMVDMGLFSLDLNARPIALTRSAAAKAAPEESAVWQLMQAWRTGKL